VTSIILEKEDDLSEMEEDLNLFGNVRPPPHVFGIHCKLMMSSNVNIYLGQKNNELFLECSILN
jgi:hypothetical protein